jgi:hypothetical protein
VPFWPSRGVRTGAVDEPPSRGAHRPLVGFGGVPRTRITSTLDGYGFHPARPAFRRPSGSTRCDLPRGRSHAGALPTLSCPFRGVRRSPARSRRLVSRHGGPCNLSWASAALRHTLGAMKRDDRGSTRGPAGRVRRFGYLLRDLFIAPPGARSAGASMGFPLQGVLPVRGGAPSRGPCPPAVVGPRAAP